MGGVFGKNKRSCLFPRVVYRAKGRKAARVCCDAATWTGESHFHSARIGRTPRDFQPPAARLVLEASGSESGGEEGGSAASPRAQHSEVSVPAAAGDTPGAELSQQPGASPRPELLKHQEHTGETPGSQNPEESSEAGAVLHPPGSSVPRRGDRGVTPLTRTTVEVDVHVSAGEHEEPGQGQAAAESELLSGAGQEDGAGSDAEQEDAARSGAGSDKEQEDGAGSDKEQEDGAGSDAEQEDAARSGAGSGAEQEDGAGSSAEHEDGAGSDAEQEDAARSGAERSCVGKALWEVPLQKAGDTTAASCPPELPPRAAEPGEGVRDGQRAAQEQGGEETKAPPDLQLGQGEVPAAEGAEGAEQDEDVAEACGDGETPEQIPGCLPEPQEEEKIKASGEGKAEEH